MIKGPTIHYIIYKILQEYNQNLLDLYSHKLFNPQLQQKTLLIQTIKQINK